MPNDAMFAEHQAWLGFCNELKFYGVDINVAHRVHASVTLWGECLAILRSEQNEGVRASAYREAADRAANVLFR